MFGNAIRFANGFGFCQSECSPKASGRRGFEKRIAFPKSREGALAPGQRLLGNGWGLTKFALYQIKKMEK